MKTSPENTPEADSTLRTIQRALTDNDGSFRIESVHTLSGPLALRLSTKPDAWDTRGRFKPVGPLLLPGDGQSVADLLRTMANLIEDV